MEDKKPWYASRTVWVGAAQVAVGAALATGVIDETTAGTALGQAPEVVGGVVGAVLGAASIYYRSRADKTLGK